MSENRFYYSHSPIYGWTVYDRQAHHIPAYDACCEMLPPVRIDEDGTRVMESPIMLESEYKAMRLCLRLNGAERRLHNGGI